MTRIRYTMPARSQGILYTQRVMSHLEREDVHRWAFAFGMTPDVEFTVRKWLRQRLDRFYCDLQPMYTPHYSSATGARTHVVLQCPPPPTALAGRDEFVSVGLQGLNPRDAVKSIVNATGLSPHLAVRGWPFCLDDADDVNDADGGAA